MLGFDKVELLSSALVRINQNWTWAVENNQRPVAQLLFGSPGIGKTMGIYSLVKDKEDALIVTVPSSTIEPCDIAGAMYPYEDHFKYLPPEWAVPLLERNCKAKWVILFLDDISTAARQVQTAMFKLIHEGQFGPSNRLAKNILYILAGNRPEDEAGAQKILTPLGSRCQMFSVSPDVTQWLEIALQNNFHPTVRAVISSMNDLLNQFDPKVLANPCPRTWEMVSKIFYAAEYAKRAPSPQDIEGVVGTAATSKLFAFLRSSKHSLSPQQIISDPQNVKMPEKMEAYYVSVSSLEAYVIQHPNKAFEALQFLSRQDCPAPDLAAAAGVNCLREGTSNNDIELVSKLFASKEMNDFMNRFPALVGLSETLRKRRKGL